MEAQNGLRRSELGTKQMTLRFGNESGEGVFNSII
jgi:hypothetical protein